MSNKNTEITNNAVVDTAFVPNMSEKTTMTAAEREAAYFASRRGWKVTTPSFAKPENGEHNVVIHNREIKVGTYSDYFAVTLKDVDKNIAWVVNISVDPSKETDELTNFLNEINMYNSSMLYRLSEPEALGRLEKRNFKVWTQRYKDDKGNEKTKTYTNPDKYERFARVQARKQAEQAEKEASYKARKSSKAGE